MHDLTQKEYQELLLEHSDFKHQIEDLQGRLSKCEDQQEAMNSLTRSVDRLTVTVGNMVDEHKELKSEVKAIKEAPVSDFNYYKRTIISCIATTIIGAVLGAVIALIISNS